MSSIVAGPPEVEIDYPEGPRVPVGNRHSRRRIELLLALRHWYARRGVMGAWVCCNINIYYREGDPKVVVAPDIAVAFGVDAAAQEPKSTYKVWEAGAAPCFALEIAEFLSCYTPKTPPPTGTPTDLALKSAKYAELGVDEYWRLDSTGGELLDPPLQGERCRAGRWAPIKVVPDGDGLRARSDVLGLDLCWQPPKLRLWDIANSAWLPDPDDLSEVVAARVDQQVARADEQAALAAQQAARADEQTAARRAAEAELAELRARLDRP